MYSSSLTSNSSIYFQDCSGLGPYYEAIQMNVTVTGYYTFLINSEMNATYGYIYRNNFNVFNWLENVLIHDGDYENRGQFQLKAFLQANMKYIFVMTTFSPSLRGNFSIQVSGPSYIGFNRILNTPSVVQTIYISELTTNSSTYLLSCSSSSSSYEAIQVNVRRSGFYTFFSNSNMDTYGSIYKDYFNPSDPMKNRLLENDHGCGQDQFRFTIALETNVTYILVATTFNSNIIGVFSIFVSGPDNVDLKNIMNTPSVVQTTYTSKLTTNSSTYLLGCSSSTSNYEEIQVNVRRSGFYTFFSKSNMDTYGVIYKDYFNPYNPNENRLLYDAVNCAPYQSSFRIALEAGVRYILIVTTYDSKATGEFSIFVSGSDDVDLKKITAISSVVQTVYASELTTNSSTYLLGCSSSSSNYEAIQQQQVNHHMLV
ncbi:unnamed protein product [Adineta steineri]|uniref:Uncharacterized protein n=1 Tax=Adineta steineri TaxID=433720 RepID=A0A815DZZ8_9BILA|nr:unnamed protein product [Adineta steineri]CAF1529820.1 unnamed protein product [Adineta steineri]